MPGVTQDRIDSFLTDLRAAVAGPGRSPATVAHQVNGRRSLLRLPGRQSEPAPA